jgi:hypothetical protein
MGVSATQSFPANVSASQASFRKFLPISGELLFSDAIVKQNGIFAGSRSFACDNPDDRKPPTPIRANGRRCPLGSYFTTDDLEVPTAANCSRAR